MSQHADGRDTTRAQTPFEAEVTQEAQRVDAERHERTAAAEPTFTSPPDPDPNTIPGADIGGGVRPGETPPESAQTSATANRDPAAGRNLTGRAVVTFVLVALFVALFASVGVYLVAQLLS